MADRSMQNAVPPCLKCCANFESVGRMSSRTRGKLMRVDCVGSGRNFAQPSPFQQLIKRCFDLIASFLALMLLSPLVVIVSLLTMLLSRRSMLCRLQFYDFNERPFEVFQFRCSVAGRELNRGTGASWIDQFLDRSSLNEILLLISILRGDMSLVGPRPLSKTSQVVTYRAGMPATYFRGVRPGLVSWAQVKETQHRNSTDDRLRRNIEDDCYYLANRSFWFDLKILFMATFSIRSYS